MKTRLLLAPLLGLVFACSGTTTPPTTDSGVDTGTNDPVDTGVVVDTGVTEDDTGVVDTGIDLTRDPTCTQGSWIVILDGRLTDENGTALQAKAQVCIRAPNDGIQVCLRPEDTDAQGEFSVVIPENTRCMGQAVMRDLAPLQDYATSYCMLDISADEPITTIPDVALYSTTRVANLPPEGDRTQARTVTFAEGLEVDITPMALIENYDLLASRKLAASDPTPCAITPTDDFDEVWAFSPELDSNNLNMPIRVPNSQALAPGAIVDFYVLGGLNCKLPGEIAAIEEAHWEPYGIGTVNAAGTFIEGEMPCLNWFAYKAR